MEDFEEDWEAHIAAKVLTATSPSLDFKSSSFYRKPASLGFMVGQMKILWDELEETNREAVERIKHNQISYGARVYLNYLGIKPEELLEELRENGSTARVEAQKAVRRCLSIASDQAGDEWVDFIVGVQKGASKPIIGGLPQLPGETEATPIHRFLFSYGHLCKERLNSLAELHAVLYHLYGTRIGNYERVKGVCKRVKYSIKMKGRPKGGKRDAGELVATLFSEMIQAKNRVDESIINTPKTVHA
ncbi:MAG: hypothetical protein HRU46_20110 [Verrucomicrobiales bacterium]|nr:hypothetical protein [Verrucomicrobiales bacterium]